jgi:hypothetical protein
MTPDQASPPKQKLSSRVLRERIGPPAKTLTQLSARQAKIRAQLRGALKDGPRTVPAIAAATGLPSREVFWHLMSLKKYGEVLEGAERDGYVEYLLKPKDEKRP